MPWENIGSVDTGELRDDGEWIEFCQKLAIRYLLFVCGDPPAYTTLDIMTHDHELGSYTSIGLWYEFDEPREYVHKCEEALNVLNSSVNWFDLKDHCEDSFVDHDVEDVIDATSDDFEDSGNRMGESAVNSDHDFPVGDFAAVGAAKLIDGLAAEIEYLSEDFYEEMKADFGEIVVPHWQEIFDESFKLRNKWLNETRFEMTNENVEYEYGWKLSDDEIAELLGEPYEDDDDLIEIEKEITEAKEELRLSEQKVQKARQELEEVRHKIAREFELLATGSIGEDSFTDTSTETTAPERLRADIDDLGFYSQAYRTIQSKMPDKAPAEQVKAILSPGNGVKKEELEWLDIDSFLDENPSPTKRQVLAFIKGHNVQLEEVRLGTNDDIEKEIAESAATLMGTEAINFVDEKTWFRVEENGDGEFETYFNSPNRDFEFLEDPYLGTFKSEEEAVEVVKSTRKKAIEECIAEMNIDEYRSSALRELGVSETRFGQRDFHLAGGGNYREFVLTLPAQIGQYTPDSIHLYCPHEFCASSRCVQS